MASPRGTSAPRIRPVARLSPRRDTPPPRTTDGECSAHYPAIQSPGASKSPAVWPRRTGSAPSASTGARSTGCPAATGWAPPGSASRPHLSEFLVSSLCALGSYGQRAVPGRDFCQLTAANCRCHPTRDFSTFHDASPLQEIQPARFLYRSGPGPGLQTGRLPESRGAFRRLFVWAPSPVPLRFLFLGLKPGLEASGLMLR